MKKLHLILAFVSSLLATAVWAEPADINAADGSTLVDVMGGCWPNADYGQRRLPNRIWRLRECF